MFSVGDILQVNNDYNEKVWVLYKSQSVKNKFRARILESDRSARVGKTFWISPDVAITSTFVEHKDYEPDNNYTLGDKIILVGSCCDTDGENGNECTFEKYTHPHKHNYSHKVWVHLAGWGQVEVCIYCIRPAKPQLSLL